MTNYDYYHNKLTLNQRFKEYSEADGTFVKISVEVDGFFVEKIPPRSFTQNIIVYYKNGILKEEGEFFFCSDVKIGKWRKYDKEGKLIREENEDKKFEGLRIKPKDLLRWMESQGWIDLWNGKGQQSSFSNTPFRISFSPHGNDHAKWYVSRVTMSGTEEFIIDAETGEVISHENILNVE